MLIRYLARNNIIFTSTYLVHIELYKHLFNIFIYGGKLVYLKYFIFYNVNIIFVTHLTFFLSCGKELCLVSYVLTKFTIKRTETT